MNDIRVAELFAGIGGFRLGLEQANNNECSCISPESKPQECKQRRQWTINEQTIQLCVRQQPTFSIIWANEWNKYAAQIYRKNFGDKELIEGDITKIKADDIPDIDMLVGGFPCQPFSLAGKRKGFEDCRGTLFFEIARILQAKRPTIFLLENVDGLRSHNNGETLRVILTTLDELGYFVEWKVLNSKYFGVPQNRERIFIIGHLRTIGGPQILPIRESRKETNGVSDVSYALDANYWKSATPQHSIEKHVRQLILIDNFGGNIKQRIQGLNRASWTLGGSKTGIIEDRKIRRLTEKECERLQGFPDNWTEGISGTQRYKCLGNAVTVPVIAEIGGFILNWVDEMGVCIQ